MAIPGLTDVANAFEWWERNVVEGLTGTALRNPNTRGMLRGVPGLQLAIPSEQSFSGVDGSQTPQQVMDLGYRDAPLQRFALTSLTDPMNLIGAGIPGRAAQAAPKAIRPALAALNAVDQAPGALAGRALDTAGAIGGSLVKPVAEGAQRAISAGLDASPRARQAVQAYEKGLQAWREQALFAIPYHVQNALDNLIKPVARGDLGTAGQFVRGAVTGRNSGDELVDAMRWHELPPGVTNHAKVNHSGVLEDKIHPSVYRSFARRPEGTPEIGQGVGPDKAMMPAQGAGQVFDKMASAFEASRRLGDRIEGGARKAAFATEASAALSRQADELATQLRDLGLSDLADELVSRSGQVSTEAFRRGLSRAALPRPQVQDLVNQWTVGQKAAKSAGVDYANKLYFDYTQGGPLNDLGRNVFAFHKFATQNLPYFLRESTSRPANFNVPTNYYRVSDEYNDEHGLTGRFHGEMPIGEVGGTQMFINPMKWWSFGQLVGQATKQDRENGQTGLGETAEMLKSVGLGLNPLIDATLMKTGQYGESIPSGPIRIAQPIDALGSLATGQQVDIQRLYKDLIAPPNEFAYTDYLRNKRLAELSVRDAEAVNDPRYVRAMSDHSSPLAQQAESDVAREQGVMGLVNSLIPGGFKLLNAEERGIHENAALARQMRAEGKNLAARRNPTAGAYAEVSNSLETDPQLALIDEIQNFDKLPPDRQQAILADPAARQLLMQQLSGQLHNPRRRSTGTVFGMRGTSQNNAR